MEEKNHNNGFWFGAMMGGLLGSAALFFLGTDKGRDKLRTIVDIAENLNEDSLQELKKKATEGAKSSSSPVVSDIHNVLDKIESSLPSKKEMQKYFARDGKGLK